MDVGKAELGRDKEVEAHQQGQGDDHMGKQQHSTDCALLLFLARTEGCMDVGKVELGRDKEMEAQLHGPAAVECRLRAAAAAGQECMDMGKA